MSQSSSSQNFKNKSLQASNSGLRPSSKSKTKKEKGQQSQNMRIFASLQNVTQVKIQRLNSIQCMVDPCHVESPVKEPFTVRIYNGRLVRDVLIDTHDLINEPGGFIINLTRHGQGPDSKEIRIHLGIKEKRAPAANEPYSGVFRPGTITTTDDYARDIFRAIRSTPQLELLTAILEINDDIDGYEEKVYSEMPLTFLHKLIQTYPVTLTKFHVEIPGISPVYLPEWKFLMDQQVALRFLICNFGVVLWNFYLNTILRNSRTLERVVLRRLQTYDIANAKYFPFDWRIFSECINMTYLKVTCGCKNNGNLNMPHPPSSVFLHENMEDLPTTDTFVELHLGNIWVDPCVMENFYNLRPNLKICGQCNDLEYYDGDKADGDMGHPGRTNVQVVSVSMLDVRAEYPPSDNKNPRRSREKHLACLVLALFHIILMALGILFIIVYFRHIRNNKQKDDNKVV